MSPERSPQAPTVRTRDGWLAGKSGGGLTDIYLGIPYAAPPVGHLRWLPPRRPEPWGGIRDATRFGPDPIQPRGGRTSRAPMQAEDCLYLNVWTPKKRRSDGWPVLVWLCGGGFTAGSGAFAEEDPSKLAERGAVVVSVNIRLNVFGFLAHPSLTATSPFGASGNYGLMDLALALRFVRENAESFGGDPARIIFFGESAGATVGLLQTATPTAQAPYDRAILQSPGSFDSLLTLAEAEEHGERLGRDLEELRSLSSAEVVARAAGLAPVPPSLWLARPLRPIVDGWFITEDDPLAGPHVRAVPTIVGTNADEGAFFVRRMGVETIKELGQLIERVFGPGTDAAHALYGTRDAREIDRKVADLYGDRGINYPVARLADRLAAAGVPVHRYVYAYRHGTTRREPTHADEHAVLMDLLPHATPKDAAMSDAMQRLWLSFAETGVPQAVGVPPWPEHRQGDPRYLRLDMPPSVSSGWRAEQIAFVARHHADR